MNMLMINIIVPLGVSVAGAGFAALLRDMLRERAVRAAHTAWTVRHDAITAKYAMTGLWAPEYVVTLGKRSDRIVRPSWLYDGPNRRMLRASEIKGA